MQVAVKRRDIGLIPTLWASYVCFQLLSSELKILDYIIFPFYLINSSLISFVLRVLLVLRVLHAPLVVLVLRVVRVLLVSVYGVQISSKILTHVLFFSFHLQIGKKLSVAYFSFLSECTSVFLQ